MSNQKNTYTINGKKFARVTNILNVSINKSHFLVPWALKEGRKKTISAVWDLINEKPLNYQQTADSFCDGTAVIPLIEKEELEEIITHSVKESDRIKKKALDIGSLVHNCIEVYHKAWDGDQESYGIFIAEYYPNVVKMLHTYFRALKENKIKVLDSEQTVWHPDGFAGTLDLVAEIDGVRYIGDIKTSKRISWDMALQTCAYMIAYNERYIDQEFIKVILEKEQAAYNCDGLIRHRFILRLDKENQDIYELKKILPEQNEEDWEAFKACHVIYKRSKK